MNKRIYAATLLLVIAISSISLMVFVLRGEKPLPTPAGPQELANDARAGEAGARLHPEEPPTRDTTPPAERDAPRRFAGQLFSEIGKPLSGTAISIVLLAPAKGATTDAGSKEYGATSDPDGRFAANLYFGAYKAIVEVDDLYAEHRFELSAARPTEYWTQVVGSAGWISGRVLDARGVGRAGVVIAPMRDRTDYAYEKLRIPSDDGVLSEESGAFRIRVAASSPYLWQMAAVVNGVVAAMSPTVAPGMDDVVIRLPDDVTLQGRVFEFGTESPVPGLTLRLESRPFYANAMEVTTGADGGFTLEALPQGRYAIAAAEESVLLLGDTDVDAVGVSEMALALYTSSGGTVEGRVLSAAGEAMPDIEVRVSRNNDTRSAESGEDGSYRITGLGPGEYEIRARTENGLLMEAPPIVFGDTPETLQRDLIVDCNPLRGRVLLPDGTPVAGANVEVHNGGTSLSTILRTTAGEGGAFELPCVPGGQFVLAAEADGQRSGERGPFSLADAAGDGIELVLECALDGFVAGRVADGSGHPLAMAKVALLPESDQPMGISVSTNTDGNGLFALIVATPERYQIQVSPQLPGFGELAVRGCSQALELGPGERRTGLVVECSYPQGRIQGIVTDGSGQPVGGATVDALGRQSTGTATSRSDGSFGIAGLEMTPHIVVVQHPDFVRGRQDDITPDARDLRFALQARPLLRVLASDSQAGAPVERFRVALLSPQMYPVFGPTAAASPEGILEARVDLEAMRGPLLLVVESEGFERYQQDVQLDPSMPEQEFRVALLKASFTLHGVVQDVAGTPLAGAEIHLDALPAAAMNPFGASGLAAQPEAVADGEGKFQVFLMDAAPRTVFATLDGYAPASAVGEANGTASQPLVIQLQHAGAVQVTVLKGGEPLAGARGWLAPDGLRGETLAEGTMRWTAVTPGMATLEVAETRQSDIIAKTVDLEVRPGETTDITVELP